MIPIASAASPLKAALALTLLLATMAMVVAVTLIIALAGLGRLRADLDPLMVLAWFWHFRADPDVRQWVAAGGGLATVGTLLVGVGILRNRRQPLHGAARWATESDLKARGLRAHTGIVLGERDGRLLTLGGDEHVLLYAPTRTGKGVGVVIPNLLSWPGSTVVLDIKRENWNATAGFRSAHGQTVFLFDPFAADGRTARFNPLGHVDRSAPDAVLTLLQKMAAMLFPTPPGADPFWTEAARTGFVAVGGLIAESPERPFSLGEIYAELTAGDPRDRLMRLVARRREHGPALSPPFVQGLTDFCRSSENTFAGVRQTLTSRLNIFLSPQVRAATDTSDFDLADLRSRPMSIYLCASPDELPRVAGLYGLIFQLLVDLNTRELPVQEARPVLVLLDEFARLGRADVLAQAFSYVAGYGLRLLCVLQSPAQLRAIYGQDLTEDIMGNCGAEVVFAPKDLRTAQDLAERLGAYTYAGRSHSKPSGFSTGRRSETRSDQRRLLMLPQELTQMDPRQLLVLFAGAPPVRGRKLAYYREPAFARRLRPPPPLPDPIVSRLFQTDACAPTPASAMTFEDAASALAAEGLEAPPAAGATEAELEAWVDRFLAATSPSAEPDHEPA